MTREAPETQEAISVASALSNVAIKQGYNVDVALAFMRREAGRVLATKAGRRHPVLVTTRGTPEKFAYRVETVWTFKLGA